MNGLRLEVRLDLVEHNARELVTRLARRKIAVCGVTKATLGSPQIAHAMLDAGVASLGDSRIENIERMRADGITAEIALIRGPLLSQIDRVVEHAGVSLNTELEVITALSISALRQGVRHRVIVMVELGDLREGVMADDLPALIVEVLSLEGIELLGLGTNLACQNGIIPDRTKMDELSELACDTTRRTGAAMTVVSGGNSANLNWALDTNEPVGAITELRLGESILLGREPTLRRPIEGLRTDVFTLVAEVIESKSKPCEPWGVRGLTTFGGSETLADCHQLGMHQRVIVALGEHDVDPAGLTPPPGTKIIGASSDHLLLDFGEGPSPGVGGEVRFGTDYAALMRAFTSPFVSLRYLHAPPHP